MAGGQVSTCDPFSREATAAFSRLKRGPVLADRLQHIAQHSTAQRVRRSAHPHIHADSGMKPGIAGRALTTQGSVCCCQHTCCFGISCNLLQNLDTCIMSVTHTCTVRHESRACSWSDLSSSICLSGIQYSAMHVQCCAATHRKSSEPLQPLLA